MSAIVWRVIDDAHSLLLGWSIIHEIHKKITDKSTLTYYIFLTIGIVKTIL